MTGARTLVISPNWIGDAVMAQPLLQLLRAQQPGRPIDVLAPPGVAPVWRQMAEVDQVLETPFRHGALQLRERWKFARLLRLRAYADAYILPNTLKYALIPWLAGIRRRVGYKGESRYGLINVMHHDEQNSPRPMVAFYAALAGVPGPLPPSGVPRPKLLVEPAQKAAACARLGLDLTRPLLVFAPGAEFGPAKRWPAAHFAELAGLALQADSATQIVLLGSPKDREVCEQICAMMRRPGVSNLAGATSLAEAVALIAQAGAVVSNDSGLLHIASSLNRPVIALYGPTDPDHAPPFSDRSRALSLRLECAPCRQRECPLGHQNCMQQMGAGMVWLELGALLEAAPATVPAAGF
ncbi:lipopolysaccharide heptosyltransferase II [Janthinobacterium agaricidamnosum]|uniref:lipopolysaccharide heptosyltransferase II n=1 Tax=Janthinobacterium agaricidamnosum NBRC 102515 = DSM 9628 TaxID=1349767 RepID=W0V2X1_9BURK|nr:lipopolysaccharide heptosyltransferase II [Janthinobacterium agaricidamnosum]CDG81617.1 lipopolysaccharide heptosyltransferase II [Janthinobacterium agaricidamnosum NBRC 102515 = DSM 9628]